MNTTKININYFFLEQIAKALGTLNDRVVYVGGSTIFLYIDDISVTDFRPTKDIDCVIELTSTTNYYKFENQLRQLGFIHPINDVDNLICRWRYNDIIVDFMPTEENILGFTNIWYKDGIANAEQILLPSGIIIKIFKLEYFIASKIEAFKSRGNEDFYASHDLEDIITVLDGRKNIQEELKTFDKKILIYFAGVFESWLNNYKFINALPGLFIQDSTNKARRERLLNLFEQIIRQS